jgi:hypothetical protein
VLHSCFFPFLLKGVEHLLKGIVILNILKCQKNQNAHLSMHNRLLQAIQQRDQSLIDFARFEEAGLQKMPNIDRYEFNCFGWHMAPTSKASKWAFSSSRRGTVL